MLHHWNIRFIFWLCLAGSAAAQPSSPFALQLEGYQASLIEVEALREVRQGKVIDAYIAELHKQGERAQASGLYEATLAAMNEKQRAEEARTIPAPPAADTPTWLAKIQISFHGYLVKVDRAAEVERSRRTEAYLETLEALKRAFTQRRQLDLAVQVKGEQDRIRAGGQKHAANPEKSPFPKIESRVGPAPIPLAGAAQVNGGLLLHYRYDEGNVNEVADSSGQGHHGVGRKLLWVEEGVSGGCARFYKDRPYIKTPITLPMRQGFTAATWLRIAADYKGLVRMPVISIQEQSGMALNILTDGSVSFEIWKTDAYVRVNNGAGLELDRWYHVAGVYDGKEMALYIDGRRVGQHPVGSSPGESVMLLHIGANPTPKGVGRYRFRGSLDETMVWTRALTPGEIVEQAAAANDQ